MGCISQPFPTLLWRLIPSSGGFADSPVISTLSGLSLNSQRSLDTCLLFMVQENIPSSCIFPYVELHYYNHWSHWAIHLINCFKSSYHFCWRLRHTLGNITNNVANNTSGIIAKYFNHEPPTPKQLFKRLSRLGNGSLKAEIWFFIWFIKFVTLKDSSGMKTQYSVWIMVQVPPWDAARMSRAVQFCSTTFIIETSVTRLLAYWTLSFKAYESC